MGPFNYKQLLSALALLLVSLTTAQASVVDEVIERTEAAKALLSSLKVDENKRLANNLIIINEDDKHSEKDLNFLTTLAERPSLFISGSAYKEIFPDSKVACLFRGTPIDFVLDWYEKSPENASGRKLHDWVTSKCQKAEIGWISYLKGKQPLMIYWISPDGKKEPNGELLGGEKNTQWRFTYLGHKFRIEDPAGRIQPIDYVVGFDSINIVGEYEPDSSIKHVRPAPDYLERIKNFEHSRAAKVKKVFTDVGFKRINVPRRLWGSIQMYFYNNRNSGYIEDFGTGNFVVNWHETPSKLVVPPWDRKGEWHDLFQTVVEDWSKTKLERTDLYGIRTYYNGATLASHVDREDTHAVSAIINVDQQGMKEDWMLEIYDIYGNVHNQPMKAGDAMLYESAKCLHGRPVALKGENYTNVFFHYRPIGQPKWWRGDTQPSEEARYDPQQGDDSYEEGEGEEEEEEEEEGEAEEEAGEEEEVEEEEDNSEL